jgi:hypothetical protein
MCANCKTSEYCDCAGGASLAACSCETGERCPVCGHDAHAHIAPDSIALTEVDVPDLLVEFDSEA